MKKYIIIAILVIILAGAGISYGVYHTPKKFETENTQTATNQTAPWLSNCTIASDCKQFDLRKMEQGKKYDIDMGNNKNDVLEFSYELSSMEDIDSPKGSDSSIKITYRNNSLTSVEIPFSPSGNNPQVLTFVDLNFDGYRDLISPAYADVVGGNLSSFVYMYDAAKGVFIADPVLGSYEQESFFDKEHKTIKQHGYYADSSYDQIYEFNDGKWELMKESSIEGGIDEDVDYCIHTDNIFISGKMKQVITKVKRTSEGAACTNNP